MIISFPLGAYIVFNSDIGDDINADYPIENIDLFLAGIGLQFPVQLELGDIFIVTWCMFLILFVISFLGPKTNFIKTIIHYTNFTTGTCVMNLPPLFIYFDSFLDIS